MAAENGVLTIALSGPDRTIEGVTLAGERTLRIALPREISLADVQLAASDLAVLRDVLARSPEAITEIHRAVAAQDFARAQDIARSIELTEENLKNHYGGGAGAVIGAIILLVVLGSLLESDTPPPPPPPPPPRSPDGGVDAGTG